MESSRNWIELIAKAVELLAIVIMVVFIVIGTTRFLFHSLNKIEGAYERYRIVLGKTLLLGLELLVAADIIQTVTLDLTLTNLVALGGLVAVRTVLGWTLTVEVEGHWPWQQTRESRVGSEPSGASPREPRRV